MLDYLLWKSHIYGIGMSYTRYMYFEMSYIVYIPRISSSILKIYVGYTMTVTVYTTHMTTSKVTTGTLKTTCENQSYPWVIRYMRTGREFKETTYPDDSLES